MSTTAATSEKKSNDKNVEVKMKDVRLSYAHLFDPQEMTGDDGKVRYVFNCNFLISKKTDAGKALIEQVKDAMRRARDAQWPPIDGQVKKIKRENMCLQDGDDTDYAGYADHMYVSARETIKAESKAEAIKKSTIALIDSRKGPDGKFPRLSESDGKLYSGCYVNAIVRIYGYDGSKKGHSNRINCGLAGVQFLRHGEAFGAKPLDAENAFDDEGSEGDAFDNDGGAKPAAGGGDDLL